MKELKVRSAVTGLVAVMCLVGVGGGHRRAAGGRQKSLRPKW